MQEQEASSKRYEEAWLGETWFKIDTNAEEKQAEEEEEEEPNQDEEMMEEVFDGLGEMDEPEGEEGEEPRPQPARPVEEGEKKEKKMVAVPKQPTQEERQEHRQHHANFESWCESCVMGQGKSKQHRRKKEDTDEHVVCSDSVSYTHLRAHET